MSKYVRNYLFTMSGFTLIAGFLPYIALEVRLYMYSIAHDFYYLIMSLSALIMVLLVVFIIIYNSVYVFKLFSRKEKETYHTFIVLVIFIPIWYIIALIYT